MSEKLNNKTAKIKIEFKSWLGKAAIEIEAGSTKEAVEKAVKDGANLDGADLRCANLDGADLRCANLCGADLRCANLDGANLRCANLDGADLRCANLYGANLDGADLRCANLDGADLRCANLCGANLDGAKLNDKKLWQVRPVLQLGCCGSRDRSTTIIFYADKSEPMVYCGCFSGTIEQFEEKIHKKHSGTFHEYEYMAMVDHIKSIRKYQLEIEDGN